jgi:hypothetical protein
MLGQLNLRVGDEVAVQCKCSLFVTNIQQSIAKIYMTHFAPGPGQAIAATVSPVISLMIRRMSWFVHV